MADEGTPEAETVLSPEPCSEGPSVCEDDEMSLCGWCCVVDVGDEEEFDEGAPEFCCPPAAIEYAGPCGNWAGFDAPLGLALPFEGGAPDDVDRPNEFDLLGVVLVGVVTLLPLLSDNDLSGRVEFCKRGSLFTGFLGDDAGGGGGGYKQQRLLSLINRIYPPLLPCCH